MDIDYPAPLIGIVDKSMSCSAHQTTRHLAERYTRFDIVNSLLICSESMGVGVVRARLVRLGM